jgi:GT2 family glycosyltransferase
MLFSIVIPTYNRSSELIECISCLADCYLLKTNHSRLFQIEIIITDDARDAQLQLMLLNRFPQCKYIKGPQRGPAANRNHGARHAKGDWLVFTDDDCIPQPGWIEAYAKYASEYEVMEGQTLALGIRSRADEESPINDIGGLLWSCNFAMKRKIFLSLGGFNEDFPSAAMEDVELNLRVDKKQLARVFIPEALVLHPWRRRKGSKFAKDYASSVAKYVSLHPEMASIFSATSQVLCILRSLKRNLGWAFSNKTIDGLPRQIFLDINSSYLAWKAVWQDR